MSVKGEKAKKLFEEGYNCCQSVVGAFCEDFGMDFNTIIKMVSPLGAGMGRMREVCGAVSGMFIVLGMKEGYNDPKAFDEKKEVYEKVQNLAKEFQNKNGSIICRELLGLNIKTDNPTPSKRTDEYYKKRPCGEIVKIAADILEKELSK